MLGSLQDGFNLSVIINGLIGHYYNKQSYQHYKCLFLGFSGRVGGMAFAINTLSSINFGIGNQL